MNDATSLEAAPPGSRTIRIYLCTGMTSSLEEKVLHSVSCIVIIVCGYIFLYITINKLLRFNSLLLFVVPIVSASYPCVVAMPFRFVFVVTVKL